jgi:hypothetical protein
MAAAKITGISMYLQHEINECHETYKSARLVDQQDQFEYTIYTFMHEMQTSPSEKRPHLVALIVDFLSHRSTLQMLVKSNGRYNSVKETFVDKFNEFAQDSRCVAIKDELEYVALMFSL